MTRSAALVSAMALVAMMISAAPAVAQTTEEPRGSMTGAYVFLQQLPIAGLPSTTFPFGWMATGTHRLGGGRWSAVGEFGISYRSDVDEQQLLMGAFGGARLTLYRSKRAALFAQGLVGYERFSEPGLVESGVAVQPGGGVDLYMSSRVFLRAEGDYRWSKPSDAAIHTYRVVGGIGIAFSR